MESTFAWLLAVCFGMQKSTPVYRSMSGQVIVIYDSVLTAIHEFVDSFSTLSNECAAPWHHHYVVSLVLWECLLMKQ